MADEITIAHLKKGSDGGWVIQSNTEHSNNVAALARQFAAAFDMGDWGYIMGLLHDKGKERSAFQQYIRHDSGYDLRAKVPAEHYHAFVGGLIVKRVLPQYYTLMGNPIMGHHRGLYDYTDLEEQEAKDIPTSEGVTLPTDMTPPALPKWWNTLQLEDIHHIERMLFSCLVDADWLDTEAFMKPEQAACRRGKSTLTALYPRLEKFLQDLANKARPSAVNTIRQEIQQACRNSASDAPGFYSLTVPTGGGKTLSSLLWAMLHAVKYGKRRIIIAIPYTSIIVQTAATLRHIFGPENVLEHHSNVTIDEDKDEATAQAAKLATENWDYPIIVTTNVQLFESMMSHRSSACRKLHNIAESVLILDEVQTLPTGFLQPIVDTLSTYERIFGVSVLFTTASQPVLAGKHRGTNPSVLFQGLSHITEIIPADAHLHDRLRRVTLSIDETPRTYDEIAQQLMQHDRVLCIVNTRRDAKEIFDRLPDEGIKIHLSRMMCPCHVSQQIANMKSALQDPTKAVIRVVSTQLIEAGVDIDFPVVYRQEAGLDAILQAAGRCNREGKQELCTTYMFSLTAEHSLPRGYITQCNNARRNMGSRHDWFSPEAMACYFLQLYSRINSFDAKDIKALVYERQNRQMEEASKAFRLIDDATQAVIVHWQDSPALIERLKSEGPSYTLMRQLGQYAVNLRQHNLDQMVNDKIVEQVVEGIYVAADSSQYDEEVGLLTANQWLEETLII